MTTRLITNLGEGSPSSCVISVGSWVVHSGVSMVLLTGVLFMSMVQTRVTGSSVCSTVTFLDMCVLLQVAWTPVACLTISQRGGQGGGKRSHPLFYLATV